MHGYTTLRPASSRRHGTGRGCDICKPAVASILASQLERARARRRTGTLQDTNDAYLANIQRNGTYSVVPRIPGGEITPEKLIVIGEVARDFGLYTKITGGQRIDLFGARMEQLPAIWRRLVDAGFESGPRVRQVAAHGEVVRRLDLVPLRRAGLRAARDRPRAALPRAALAAQAQGRRQRLRPRVRRGAGKDFGVIATEKGWNLYVGGNGGATPATPSCSPATSTPRRWSATSTGSSCTTSAPPTGCSAPRPGSTRSTAAWTGSARSWSTTSLGLGAELEAAMARHVDTYFDEWKATLDDPEKLARFVSFVNAPDVPDPNISFRERARPGRAGRLAGPVSLGATIPVGAPSMTPSDVDAVCRARRRSRSRAAWPRWCGGAAVAIFRTHDGNVYAMSNYDPFSQASVLARGIVGTRGDVPFVASPMHKQAFDLRTGQCLDDAAVRVTTYDVRVADGMVLVGSQREEP